MKGWLHGGFQVRGKYGWREAEKDQISLFSWGRCFPVAEEGRAVFSDERSNAIQEVTGDKGGHGVKGISLV